jgi:hypothetical protein
VRSSCQFSRNLTPARERLKSLATLPQLLGQDAASETQARPNEQGRLQVRWPVTGECHNVRDVESMLNYGRFVHAH